MGKRYRSLRKEIKMNLKGGKMAHFHGFRFPPKGQPACKDKEVIAAIEAKPGFGKLFWEEIDPDEILINPQAVPPDCEAAHLQNAAKRMAEMGIHVNPKLLASGAEAPQLPAKTVVRGLKKNELQELVDKFGWEIDKDQKVPELREDILATIEELSD